MSGRPTIQEKRGNLTKVHPVRSHLQTRRDVAWGLGEGTHPWT